MKTHLALTVLAACLLQVAVAKPINTGVIGKTAIKGYDPVAYFTQRAPAKGSKSFVHSWEGATWRFASAANRDLFKADPDKYAPQYGGFCAYAVSQNSTANIDPDQWTIVNGKLFLNYNAKIQKKWLANRDPYIKDADTYWPELKKK